MPYIIKSQIMENQKEKFEDFCRGKFANGKSTSKTITREKGQQITSYLKGDIPPPDPTFKHWVSKKGFKLLDYPILGLKNVLCLPTKKEDANNPTFPTLYLNAKTEHLLYVVAVHSFFFVTIYLLY